MAELVTQLKNVRAQQEALEEQEKKLLDQIAKKVDEQRRELQKAEQLLQQLRLSGRVPQKDKGDFRVPYREKDKDFRVPQKDKGDFHLDKDKGK